MEDCLKVGVITSTHGVRGEVKLFPTTDDVNRFKKLKEAKIHYMNQYVDVTVSGARFFKNMVILKFKDIDNINDVEKYKGCDLVVTRNNAVKLEKDEYFMADLLNAKMVSDDGKVEGVLFDILSTGANDVYVLKTDDGHEVLLPAIHECIKEVNVEEKRIIFHLMEGLMD